MAVETNDLDMPRLFAVAERLHVNYYHSFIKAETLPACEEDIEKLIDKLKKLVSAR